VFGTAVAAVLAGCSSTDTTPSGGAGSPGAGGSGASTGGTSSGGSAPTAGDPAKGALVWANKDIACASCHAETAAGQYGPNITMSKTAGIGNWTFAQFKSAVRDGLDMDGKTMLCTSMTRFPKTMIDDQAMADLYAYIGTKPISDVHEQGIFCP